MWGFFRVENEHLNNTEVGLTREKANESVCLCVGGGGDIGVVVADVTGDDDYVLALFIANFP